MILINDEGYDFANLQKKHDIQAIFLHKYPTIYIAALFGYEY